MLKPAQLYKEQLSAALIKTWYDPRYQFYNADEYCGVPDFQNNNERYWQFVSVDNDDNLLGYISFCADRKTMTANWWGALSFHIGDIRFIRDLFDMVHDVFYKYGFERISWICVADNPAVNGYWKFIKRHGGRECGYYRQNTRLMDGKLHDEVCFEILKSEFSAKQRFFVEKDGESDG
ncbi:MAG: GNAT family N-acetyltransferase [Ruminococcaceae bacterium]|nr:GNAT family N-acetyltransferase [Oscillospiraceae bacterium]